MMQAGLLLVKATLIVSVALVGCRLMRRRRAALRHAVMASAFGILLVLPVASFVGPTIKLEIPVEAVRLAVPASVPAPATAANPVSLEVGSVALIGSATMPSSAVSPAAVMLVAWASGVLLCLLPMFAGLWRMRSLRRCGRRWPLGERLVRDAAVDAGMGRHVDVLLQDGIASPVTYGAARPTIALPPDAETWTKDELERAIAHELEHVRRADWLTQCLARAICATYWFHPLVWIAWRRLGLDAERACDDAVLRRAEPTAYADHLIVMAARRTSGLRRPVIAMAGHDDLSVRVRAILDSAQERGRAGAASIALTASTAMAVVAAFAPLHAVAVPRTTPAVLVSPLPADPARVAANVSEAAVTREARHPLPLGRRSASSFAHPLDRPERYTTAPKPDTIAMVVGPKDEYPAFVAVADRQAQNDTVVRASVDRQLWILLFDVTSLQPDAIPTVVENVRRVISRSPPSVELAIVTVGTRITVVSDFTSSREEVIAALQSPGFLTGAGDGLGTLAMNRVAETTPGRLDDIRLRALATVCNTVAPIKDVKHLLYFSSRLAVRADKDPAELRAAVDACLRANASINPVDARGLLSIPDPNAPAGTFRTR